MNSRGRPWEILKKLRVDYPLSFHGVSLSLGAYNPLNFSYLDRLKEMILEFDPFLVSDHLCFTGVSGSNTHNLLPFIYNDESLNFLCEKVDQVQVGY
jgi:uncharacterized protein (UPF0276 family)